MAGLITQSPLGTRLAPWLESAWLQRYLERRLDAEETAWFEAYVLDKPALLERIEQDADLRDALAAVGRGGTGLGAQSQPTDSDPANPPVPVARRRRAYAPAFALAASLIAGLGIGWLSGRQATPDGAALIASPMRVVFDTERGAATAPRVEHADSQAPLMLVEIAVPPGAQRIGVQMDNAQLQVLPPSADGFVTFLARRDAGKAGHAIKLTYLLDGREQNRSFVLDAAGAGATR